MRTEEKKIFFIENCNFIIKGSNNDIDAKYKKFWKKVIKEKVVIKIDVEPKILSLFYQENAENKLKK